MAEDPLSNSMTIEQGNNELNRPKQDEPANLADFFTMLDEEEKAASDKSDIVSPSTIQTSTETQNPSQDAESDKKNELRDRFSELEKEATALREQHKKGEITRDELTSKLHEKMISNEEVWWMVGVDTNKWYRWESDDSKEDKGMWIPAEPPLESDSKREESQKETVAEVKEPLITESLEPLVAPIVTEASPSRVKERPQAKVKGEKDSGETLEDKAERELSEPPTGVFLQAQERTYWESLDALPFARIQFMRENALDRLDANPNDVQAATELRLLDIKTQQMLAFAEVNNLFRSINNKRDILETELRKMLRANDTAAQQEFVKKLKGWKGTDNEKSLMFQGMAEYRIAEHRRELQAVIDTQNARIAGRPLESIPSDLIDRSKSPAQRLVDIERLEANKQREALNVILNELERPEMTPDDSTFKNYRSALETVMPLLDSENRRMVDARLKLQVCWSALQKVNTADSEQAKGAFGDATRRIGSYALDGEAFNVFLAEKRFGGEIPGLYTSEAMTLLQDAALRGEYSRQRADDQSLIQDITQELMRRHSNNGLTVAEAQKSVELADRLAEATFEKSLWDTTGGDAKIQSYMSEAMYFSTWRIAKNKGYAFSAAHIPTIGTSFLRRAKYADSYGKKRVFFSNEWDALSANTNATAKQRNDALIEYQTIGGSRPSALSFEGVDFTHLETGVYRNYLESYVPKVLEIKDILTKTEYSLSAVQNDGELIKMYEKLKQFDPNNSMQLFYFYYCHALRGAAFAGAHASQLHDEVTEIIDIGLRAGKQDPQGRVEVAYKMVQPDSEHKYGQIYPFNRKSGTGRDMWDVIATYSGYESPARENAFDDALDRVNLLRVVGADKSK